MANPDMELPNMETTLPAVIMVKSLVHRVEAGFSDIKNLQRKKHLSAHSKQMPFDHIPKYRQTYPAREKGIIKRHLISMHAKKKVI